MKQSPPVQSGYSRPPRGLTIPILGTLASLLLHALLLTSLFLGGNRHHNRTPNSQNSSSNSNSNEDPAMTLVFVEEPDSGAARDRQADYVTSLLAFPSPLLAPVAVPDIPLATPMGQSDPRENEEATVVQANTSDPGRSKMFGRYVGQIDARIQRAWIRPRTAIDSGSFACRARITQDRSGSVQEIELVRCNGNAAWQVSLVHAIQSASPLPAPPDPKVFSRVVTLDFTSLPFSPDGSSEGFEPELHAATR
jgi:hypothetical protein